METVGSESPSRIVPIPWSSGMVALVGVPMLRKNCSVPSNTPSPKTCTSIVAEVEPAGMVKVPPVEP